MLASRCSVVGEGRGSSLCVATRLRSCLLPRPSELRSRVHVDAPISCRLGLSLDVSASGVIAGVLDLSHVNLSGRSTESFSTRKCVWKR